MSAGGDVTRWYGWRWEPPTVLDDGRWVRVCVGASLLECHRELNKVLPKKLPNSHAAMTGGMAPTWRPTT